MDERAWLLQKLDQLADTTDRARDAGLITTDEAVSIEARTSYQRRRLTGQKSRIRVEVR